MTAPAKPQPAKAASPTPATTKPKAARKPVDPNESKSQKFVRLGRKRLTRVLKGMEGLEALGRGQYEYTPEQANKVLQHLVDGVAKVKAAFAPRGGRAAQELVDL